MTLRGHGGATCANNVLNCLRRSTMNVSKRNTKKSRIVAEMAECTADLVLAGNIAPAKGAVVTCVINNSLGEGASTAIKTLLEDELANELERYYAEVCKAASIILNGAPYHYVKAAYYKKLRKFPESKEEARERMVLFGNGTTGKAVGVRYVLSDKTDLYLAVQAEKQIDNVNSIINRGNEKLVNMANTGALPPLNLDKLAKPSKLGLKKD